MKTIYLLKGLPASGKSTWSRKKQEEDPNVVRVNKDDLRSMLHNGKWSKHNEKQVLRIRDLIIIDALKQGRHIIVDDTNLHHKHEDQLRIIAKKHNAKVEVVEFDIDVKECIKRDLKRSNSVGSEVIQRMYKQFIYKQPDQYIPNESKPLAIICDIDGTLATMKNRSPFDWHLVGNDELNKSVFDTTQSLQNHGYELILMSGRDSVCRKETQDWLKKNNIEYSELLMRKEGDIRKDNIVKKELFDSIKDKYAIKFVLDDRNQVVEMWRSIGLQCFQVADGDF